MTREQWLTYLSGVAADCVVDDSEAQRLSRQECVNPCADCAAGFRSAAEAKGACQPAQFIAKPVSHKPGGAPVYTEQPSLWVTGRLVKCFEE